MNLPTYWERVTHAIQDGIQPFQQCEKQGKTVRLRGLAHRFSAYEAYDQYGKLMSAGINSFQLEDVDGQWRIVAIVCEEDI